MKKGFPVVDKKFLEAKRSEKRWSCIRLPRVDEFKPMK